MVAKWEASLIRTTLTDARWDHIPNTVVAGNVIPVAPGLIHAFLLRRCRGSRAPAALGAICPRISARGTLASNGVADG